MNNERSFNIINIIYGIDVFVLTFLFLSRFTMLKSGSGTQVGFFVANLKEFAAVKALISAGITGIVMLNRKRHNANEYNELVATIAVLLLVFFIIAFVYCSVVYFKTLLA